MRIAFPLGGTDWGRSGIGTYVRAVLPRLARLLSEQGGSLAVLGSPRDFDAYGDLVGDGAYRVAVPGLVDAPGASALWYMAQVGAVARRSGADVLLLPAANRRVALRPGLPTVAVVHDLAQLHVPEKYDALRMLYFRRVVVPALGSARVLVAVSEATRRDLQAALDGAASGVRVVPNGVDHERFAPPEPGDSRVDAVRHRHGLTGPYLLYASRLEHPGKNHLRLLDALAASSVRDTHTLALAGKDWGAEERIRGRVRDLGLGDRVRLLGFVPDEDMPGLVAGADAVIMVGLREGFGLPALEALAAGRTVCAADAGALPEVVGELAALCDPLDPGSIRDALERSVSDGVLRGRCAAEGPSWAAAHGWDRTAEGLLRACEEAVG